MKSLKRGVYIALTLGLFFLAGEGVPQNRPSHDGSLQKVRAVDYILEDFQVNENAGRCAHNAPEVAVTGSGAHIVTWTDARNGKHEIFFQRYDNTGTPIVGNQLVDTNAGDNPRYGSTIGADGSGNFVIAWEESIPDGSNYDIDIYFQRFQGDGTPLGNPVKVNDGGSFWSAGYSFDRPGARIAVAENGMFAIAWKDERNGNTDIYCQRYDALGSRGTYFGS